MRRPHRTQPNVGKLRKKRDRMHKADGGFEGEMVSHSSAIRTGSMRCLNIAECMTYSKGPFPLPPMGFKPLYASEVIDRSPHEKLFSMASVSCVCMYRTRMFSRRLHQEVTRLDRCARYMYLVGTPKV